MEILMQQLLHSNHKICCWLKFLSTKKLFHQKTGSWLQSCKMTGHGGAYFDYNNVCAYTRRWILSSLYHDSTELLVVYQKGDIVKDPMKSIPFLPKIVPGVGWGGVGHARVGWSGVGWVMQGWGGVG